MPSFLIRINNKRTWDREAYAEWLDIGQAPADVFRDFRVAEGILSVWHIENDRSNLNLVVAALAATRQSFDVFDYALFNQELTSSSDIKFLATAGDTPIPSANLWHRDLTALTANKLSVLVNTLFDVIEKERISKQEVKSLIVEAARDGKIEFALTNDVLRPQILTLIGSAKSG